MQAKQNKKTVGHRIFTAVGVILCVIFMCLLVCNLIIIIKGELYPDRPPSVAGYTPMVVLSGSMSGTAEDHIEVGDLIFIGKTEPDQLQNGDVIAYMQGDIIVTHRIIETQTAEDGSIQWITQGDANNAPDADPVPAAELVGRYLFRIPKLGDFALFMQTPIGMLLFIGGPISIFIIYDVLRRQRFARKQNTKQTELEAELERLRKLAGEDK